MRIQLRETYTAAGPGGVIRPGAVADVSDAEGEELIAEGYADRIDVPPPAPPVEPPPVEPPPVEPPPVEPPPVEPPPVEPPPVAAPETATAGPQARPKPTPPKKSAHPAR